MNQKHLSTKEKRLILGIIVAFNLLMLVIAVFIWKNEAHNEPSPKTAPLKSVAKVTKVGERQQELPQQKRIEIVHPHSNNFSFNCEPGAICLSANKTNMQILTKSIDHLNPTLRHDYILIVSEKPISEIANRSLFENCTQEKLCFIRNKVLKETMISDLKRIGQGEKNVYLKVAPSKPN